MPATSLVRLHFQPTAWRAASLASLAALGTGAAAILGFVGAFPWPLAVLLVLAGAGGLATCRALPALHVSPVVAASVGAVLLVGVIMHAALSHAAFDVRWIMLALLGVGLQLSAPYLDNEVRLPGRRTTAGTLVASVLALVGTPLVAWALLAGY